MVTQDQIQTLPRKYAIGKRPLSRILGWGELTYTRLLEGSTPTPQHAEELEKVLNNPLASIMLLDRAYEKGLVADASYKRSRKAAESHLGESAEGHSTMKLHSVAKYICALANGDITPHALQILVYYAQGHALAKLDSPLFEEQPRALDDGPAYDAISDWFTFERIQEAGASGENTGDGLSEKEQGLLKNVFDQYGVYSASKLAEMACSESPWKKTRKRVDASDGSEDVISQKRMAKYFSKALA